LSPWWASSDHDEIEPDAGADNSVEHIGHVKLFHCGDAQEERVLAIGQVGEEEVIPVISLQI
jgi:hypothetical protein